MESARCPVHADATLRPGVVRATDRFWGTAGEFTYGACPTCGTWVLDPRPTPAEMGPHYANYYSDTELADRRAAFEKHPPEWALGVDRLRALDAVKRLRKVGATLTEDAEVLDAGCGVGGFARAMRDLTGAKVRGVDFDPKCQAFAAEVHALEVDTGELADQAYADGRFDVVTSWHCLEHVYDPAKELAELFRITRPGGHLLLEVPTLTTFARIFRGRWLFLQAPTHLFHFRPKTLRTLVTDAGFTVKQLKRPWLPSELAGSLLMALGMSGFAPRLLVSGRPVRDRLWGLLFGLLLLVDVPLTLLAALLGDAGVVRVVAERRVA